MVLFTSIASPLSSSFSLNMSVPNDDVRIATPSDIAAIETWLPAVGSVDTLACNWPMALREFEKGQLLVWEDKVSAQPVAYFWGTLNSTDSVLEVHPHYRCRGVGRAFAEYLMGRSAASEEPLLEIECPTESSVHFWRALGFSVERTRRGGYSTHMGRRILALPQELPDGPRVQAAVRFLSEEATHGGGSTGRVLSEWSGAAVCTSPTRTVLPLKVACFNLDNDKDLAVEVTLRGHRVCLDKAKYSGEYGVRRCENGFMIGAITHE